MHVRRLRLRVTQVHRSMHRLIFGPLRTSLTVRSGICPVRITTRHASMPSRQKTRRSPRCNQPSVPPPASSADKAACTVMCRLFNVTGRVQGVFFRVSTRDIAAPLGLKGHSINLPDGSVEVRACGGDAALDQLQAWLHEGPPQASVSAVNERLTECTAPARFTTG